MIYRGKYYFARDEQYQRNAIINYIVSLENKSDELYKLAQKYGHGHQGVLFGYAEILHNVASNIAKEYELYE